MGKLKPVGGVGLTDAVPGGGGGAQEAGIRAGGGIDQGKLAMAIPPDLSSEGGFHVFPVQALGKAEIATENDGVGIEHVDEPTDAGPKRLGRAGDDPDRLRFAGGRSREHILRAIGGPPDGTIAGDEARS